MSTARRVAMKLRYAFSGGVSMVLGVESLSPAIALLFGVLILIFPRMLNYLVAIYLILAGLLGLGVIALR
jgi:uncharacterized membrane protein